MCFVGEMLRAAAARSSRPSQAKEPSMPCTSPHPSCWQSGWQWRRHMAWACLFGSWGRVSTPSVLCCDVAPTARCHACKFQHQSTVTHTHTYISHVKCEPSVQIAAASAIHKDSKARFRVALRVCRIDFIAPALRPCQLQGLQGALHPGAAAAPAAAPVPAAAACQVAEVPSRRQKFGPGAAAARRRCPGLQSPL